MPLLREFKCSVRVETRFLRRFRCSHLYLQLSATKSQLSYSGHDCKTVPPALNNMFGDMVECLDLSYNSLISIAGIYGFPKLRDLILDNNKITDIEPLAHMPNLSALSLNNNLITNLEATLSHIAVQTPNLTYLSLLGNPVCPDQLSDRENDDADYQRYRYYVLHHLPGLKFLDFRRVSNAEKIEAKRRGEFLRVRRPNLNQALNNAKPMFKSAPYTALPVVPSSKPQHKGAYGKCLYKYTGKHSEGNRFICNSDL